jgi:putative colanic acid biosynthesis acetyltransferase WcaF
MSKPVDISANRSAQKWTKRELIGRLLWEMLGTRLFAWSPRPAWGWRRAILRLFGANIGADVRIDPSALIAIPWNLAIGNQVGIGARAQLYSLGAITIGDSATISQNAHLCAGSHDFRSPDMRLTKPPIMIGEGAWICADAFVGPGVSIGDLAVVGARAVVIRNVGPGLVVAGNPAAQVGKR